MRSRRSCLLVPGHDLDAVERSRGAEVDEVVLDLLPGGARAAVADAVAAGGWSAPTVAVRVHDLSTPHTYRDVIEVVETAGSQLSALVLPKVSWPEQVAWLDLLLLQIERTMGLPEGDVAIEAGIETAMGLTQALSIAQASDRVEALVFGVHGFAADTGIRSEHPLYTLRVAATAAGVQAISDAGPVAEELGFDGSWGGGSHAPQVATDQ